MDVFSVGLITLFLSAIVFYIILFSFIYYWHLKKVSFVVIPMLFAFEFLLTGFLIVAIVSIIFNYLPDLIRVPGL